MSCATLAPVLSAPRPLGRWAVLLRCRPSAMAALADEGDPEPLPLLASRAPEAAPGRGLVGLHDLAWR